MRTTIAIGDYLLRTVKREARRGFTLGRLVGEALRLRLSRPAAPTATSAVPILRGAGGVRQGIDVASNRALLEALDEDRPVKGLR